MESANHSKIPGEDNINTIREDDFRSRKLNEVFKILLVVATSPEHTSIIDAMNPLPSEPTLLKLHVRDLTYVLGVLGAFPVVLVKATMMGSGARDASLATVTAALTYWEMKVVIMPGIAFGIDNEKQSIGDILVSSGLYLYENAKLDEIHGTIPRVGNVLSSSTLLDRFTQTNTWRGFNAQKNVPIRVGPILSGEKLVNDSAFKAQLLALCPNAIGGEMEGSGVFAACDRKKIDWILCKAICDWGDGTKSDEWQALAASNSAGYLKLVLSDENCFESMGIPSANSDATSSVFFGEKPIYHNILGAEILSIIHPKHQITAFPVVSMAKEQIYYEYFTVLVNNTVTLGYLFYAKNINLENAIEHFLTNQPQTYSSLCVCTPKVLSSTSGRDDFRVRNLKSKFLGNPKFRLKSASEFYFIEDYVWDRCFEHERSAPVINVHDELYFIDQPITHHNIGNIAPAASRKSLPYFSSVLQTSRKTKPLVVILGGAGVGKTTLCDQIVRLISQTPRKRTIYISSSDISSHANGETKTISDLYRLAMLGSEQTDSQNIDPSLLKVNISCGNLVVVIDGLDEIESKLKDDFHFDEFIQDAIDLNQSFNNCTVIVTCRDYYREKYEQIECVELLSLQGFDNKLAEDYFLKRCPEMAVAASKSLDSLKASFDGFYPPVVLSLICDMVEKANNLSFVTESGTFCTSKYLHFDDKLAPIDILLVKILQREIERQSLEMTVDDIFDIFIEIAKGDRGRIAKSDLLGLLEIYGKKSANELSAFVINPLLRSSPTANFVEFRYGNMSLLVKSRYFIYQAKTGFNDHVFVEAALLEFYDGKGELLVEILKYKPKNLTSVKDSMAALIKYLVNVLNSHTNSRNRRGIEAGKKHISAALYFWLGCHENATKAEKTGHILEVYVSAREIVSLFVYGNFYALDFSNMVIHDSGFYQFGNFEKSIFPKDGNVTVFCNTEFRDITTTIGIKSQKGHFDKKCQIDHTLRQVIERDADDREGVLSKVKDDFGTVFGVLYRNRMFVKKSDNIFKMKRRNLYYRLTIGDYLDYMVSNGVISKERSFAGSDSKYHYEVMEAFKEEVRYFMDNNTFRLRLGHVFRGFAKDKINISV